MAIVRLTLVTCLGLAIHTLAQPFTSAHAQAVGPSIALQAASTTNGDLQTAQAANQNAQAAYYQAQAAKFDDERKNPWLSLSGPLTPVAASMSMLSVAAGIWMSLREYRLKLQAERRAEQSAQIEAEIRLHTLFTELLLTANGRSGYQISEKAVEWFLQHMKSSGDLNIDNVNASLQNFSILTLPVGSASQDAAVAAIASLTLRHDILRQPGLRALQSLASPQTSPYVEHYLKQVQEELVNRGEPVTIARSGTVAV